MERWHQSVKNECIRPKSPVSLPDARALVEDYVVEYNTKRLHSAIGYITPLDKLEGRADAIFSARREKLQSAAKARSEAYTLQPGVEAA
ncbi:MAG: integrase core domain-containing protein [Methylococcales bacterium]